MPAARQSAAIIADPWLTALVLLGFVVMTCRVCGCDDEHACVSLYGPPCSWVAPGLCSQCADPDQWRTE